MVPPCDVVPRRLARSGCNAHALRDLGAPCIFDGEPRRRREPAAQVAVGGARRARSGAAREPSELAADRLASSRRQVARGLASFAQGVREAEPLRELTERGDEPDEIR